MSKRRVFAGDKLKSLRAEHGLRQAELAEKLGISVSYLSQIEHDDRPLTPALLEMLSRNFPLDWNVDEGDAATRRFAALREAAADPLFPNPLSPEQLAQAVRYLVEPDSAGISGQFITVDNGWTTKRRV